MDKLDRSGALSHCRCDALDGAAARVAGGEHSRHARLQEKRCALESPPAGRMARAEQVAAGQDISLGIHLDGAREPLSMGRAPDENEQTGGTQFLALTVDAFHSDRLEASVTMAVHHPSPKPHLDVGKRADLADEVVGHACSKRLAAHDHHDTRSEPRQMYSRLSRRVTSAHDKNLFACASWCFAHGRAVENANSRETLGAWYVQTAVGDASGDDNCPAFYFRTVRKGHDEPHPVCAQSGGCLGEDDGHTEPLCLLKSSVRKLPTTYTPWKAEVILNAGTRSSLATNGLWVEQDCAQTFGCGVDRGREPSRAGSRDGHVVEPGLRRCPDA